MSSKSRVKAKTGARKRPQRATSNVFAMFDQSQIQEFKEAFNMIDQNRDGFVDKEDLHDMLASLGNFHLADNNMQIVCIKSTYNKVMFLWVSFIFSLCILHKSSRQMYQYWHIPSLGLMFA